MGQNQSTPTEAGRQQQQEQQQRDNSSSTTTSSSNEDLLNSSSQRTTTQGEGGHRTPSSVGSVDSLGLPSQGRRSGLSGLSTLRLRRNAASSSLNTPVGQGTEDMDTTAMPSSSRRRRRTSSSDEMTSSARYKRRQRTNTLRRLTQFGSNFMNSLTAGQREDGEQEQPSTSSSVADNRRGSVDMLSNAPPSSSSSLMEPTSPQTQPHWGGGGGGGPQPVIVDSSRPHPTTRRSPFSLRSNRGHVAPGAGTSLTSNSDGGFESQAAMLSRLLAIAASVTATTLVGSSYRGGVGFGRSSDGPASNDTDDSFHGFLDGLNNGLLASELSNSLENPDDPTGPRRAQNFFRMFRFPPSTDSSPGMVPVLIVGIRAVDNNEEANAAPTGDPSATGPANMAADTNPENLSFFNASSSRSIRMNRSANNNNNNNTSATTTATSTNNSNNSNEAETSERRPRRPRTVYLDDDDDDSDSEDETMSFHSTQSSSRPAQSLLDRLRSPFGSSNAGSRNTADMLFDDIFSDRNFSNLHDRQHEHQESTQQQTEQQENTQGREHTRQSWIVYVVGGTYPDNHPILLAPSLFTDNPSYEDLLTLENFLGQAKPPVATREDIDSSGGIIKVDSEELRPGDRCLICLSSYETGEECRQLKTCGHMFHKECIDQWLITGRNSCPLCRGEGVKPLNSETPADDTPPVP
ncbi:hypothetical protein TRICI_005557 [Trichomonascus ciferrii]|uniref:RING-type domain-containing protein n=1 Tax=Trichomonascus ciferrii TaxID=44093 RepID=A0A642USC0_9ASCO|nr:hypothetical protein TRICI_005557 [Trichomonascus ciferrii]